MGMRRIRRVLRMILRIALRQLFGSFGQRRVEGWRLFFHVRLYVLLLTPERVGRLIQRREVRAQIDGYQAFPRLEELLRRARHTVVVQMFIWKDDETGRRMAGIMLEIADRGVQVDITKEVVGDVFEVGKDFQHTMRLKSDPWQRFWRHPNIRVQHIHRNDHAKVYVIDEQLLLISGMNIGDEYRYEWHDFLIELRGRQFVDAYLTGETGKTDTTRIVMNTQERKGIRSVVETLLEEAQESIVIEHAYLTDPRVLRLLTKRSSEGVRVSVIIPGHANVGHHANMRSMGELMGASGKKVQVLLYPGMVHGKLMLIDYRRAFVGSANLFRESLDAMGEVNVLIGPEHARTIRTLKEVLREDILRSRPLVTPPQLKWISRWLALLRL